jgi:acyl-CoA synthetase (AMP-forming)/AMP-acid ligase II
VLTTHRNLAAACLHVPVWSFDADSVSLTPLPMFHVGGIAWTYLALSQGATTIIVSEFDAATVLDLLESERVTNAVFVPTILQMLTSVPGAAARDFSALRSIAYGASPITSSALTRALEVFKAPLFQVYGLTETTGAITELSSTDHDPGGPRQHLMRSAGKPYPWVELKAVDPASGQDCTPGQVGEIWIRSVQNSPGYWGKPEDTKVAFDDDGWLHTGDAGYLDEEGYLFLVDRVKDMIVTGGENVYSAEVESAISKHEAVAQVAVIGIPHETWGEQVHAIVVLHDGASATEDDIRDHAKEHIAGYKVPKSVEFRDEPLPLSGAMKVLKKDLRAPYWADQERAVN